MVTTKGCYCLSHFEKMLLSGARRSSNCRSSHPEVFLRKAVLKIYSKFTGEHPCPSVISIKFQSNFIEMTLRCGCCPVNLLYIFRTPFPKNISGQLVSETGQIFNRFFLGRQVP